MGKRIALLILLCIAQASLMPVSSQEPVQIRIDPREPCIAGFPCELNVSVTNMDGTILLSKLRLATPWGLFVKDLGLRELRGGESLRIAISANVSLDSLEGPNFVRAELIYFVRGEVGLRSALGNSSSLMVQRPRLSVSLLASPLSYTIRLGEPLILEGSYRVDGIPREFRPTMIVYVNGIPAVERVMNSTHGLFSIPVPLSVPGSHEVNLTLSYGIGKESKLFTVIVSPGPAGYSREYLSRELNSTKRDFQSLLALYRSAMDDLIPLPGGILSNISAIDSLLAEAEARLGGDLSYEDALRIEELLNRSEKLISTNLKVIVESYRGKLLSELSELRGEIEALARVDEGAYRNLSARLDEIQGRVRSISPGDDVPKIYEEISGEINGLRELVRSRRERVLSDATTLAVLLLSLITISIVSITILILNLWRRSAGEEVS